MPLERTPLSPESLSDAARRALSGPPAMKMMAARGLAPLRPVDLACVLYTLALDADDGVKAAAEKTAGELPEKVLTGALGDADVDPRVLDFFARKVQGKAALVEVLILNRVTADETIAAMVPFLGEKDIELVAVNEQRLLRWPAIIGAMYMNRKARMSTVDRCVELAVRNKVQVPGIAAWSEIVDAVLGTVRQAPVTPTSSAELDAAFEIVAAAVENDAAKYKGRGEVAEVTDDLDQLELINETEAQQVEEEKKQIPIEQLPIPAKIRLATLGNAFARAILIRDTNKMVALAAIKSPGMTDNEVVKFAANRSLAHEVVRVIATTKEWTKLYSVKVNLTNNPKTPVAESMRLIPFLRDRELRNLARSKGIPNAVVVQAKKLLSVKGK